MARPKMDINYIMINEIISPSTIQNGIESVLENPMKDLTKNKLKFDANKSRNPMNHSSFSTRKLLDNKFESGSLKGIAKLKWKHFSSKRFRRSHFKNRMRYELIHRSLKQTANRKPPSFKHQRLNEEFPSLSQSDISIITNDMTNEQLLIDQGNNSGKLKLSDSPLKSYISTSYSELSDLESLNDTSANQSKLQSMGPFLDFLNITGMPDPEQINEENESPDTSISAKNQRKQSDLMESSSVFEKYVHAHGINIMNKNDWDRIRLGQNSTKNSTPSSNPPRNVDSVHSSELEWENESLSLIQ
ncbi:unnamed protein product [Gordionus sp. m RMFG-2023]